MYSPPPPFDILVPCFSFYIFFKYSHFDSGNSSLRTTTQNVPSNTTTRPKNIVKYRNIYESRSSSTYMRKVRFHNVKISVFRLSTSRTKVKFASTNPSILLPPSTIFFFILLSTSPPPTWWPTPDILNTVKPLQHPYLHPLAPLPLSVSTAYIKPLDHGISLRHLGTHAHTKHTQ